jgi:hypothetical protein
VVTCEQQQRALNLEPCCQWGNDYAILTMTPHREGHFIWQKGILPVAAYNPYQQALPVVPIIRIGSRKGDQAEVRGEAEEREAEGKKRVGQNSQRRQQKKEEEAAEWESNDGHREGERICV